MQRLVIFIVSLLLTLALTRIPIYAKNKNIPNSKIADPTCPIDRNWVPDYRCTSPAPALTVVKCPASLDEEGCDFYTRGYRQALEDKFIMGMLYRKDWKNDEGDEPEFKLGYEAGWEKN